VEAQEPIDVVYNGIDKGIFRTGAYNFAPGDMVTVISNANVSMVFGRDPFPLLAELADKLVIKLLSIYLNLSDSENICRVTHFAIASDGGIAIYVGCDEVVVAESQPGMLLMKGSKKAFILTTKKRYDTPNIILSGNLLCPKQENI
jgi:hypothetical protein